MIFGHKQHEIDHTPSRDYCGMSKAEAWQLYRETYGDLSNG